MHELALADALVDQLSDLAREHGLIRITDVAVTVGVRQQVVVESLAMALEAVAQGTIAEGARFTIAEEAMQARCRACQHAYAPSLRDFRCPACGTAQPDLTAGTGMRIASFTGDDGKE